MPHDSFVLNDRTICKTKQNTTFVLWFERTIQKTGFTIFFMITQIDFQVFEKINKEIIKDL